MRNSSFDQTTVTCPAGHEVALKHENTYQLCEKCNEHFSVHEYERRNTTTNERSDCEVMADRVAVRANTHLAITGAPYRWSLALAERLDSLQDGQQDPFAPINLGAQRPPAHTCVDRPHMPCAACQMGGR